MSKSVSEEQGERGKEQVAQIPCDSSKKLIAQRACVGCRKVQYKQEMIRVVRTPDGVVELDLTGKAAGRGAYLCKKPECLKAALKRRQFDRAFKTKVPADIYDRINAELGICDQE